MKTVILLITFPAFMLSLAACRPERKSAKNPPQRQIESGSASSNPAAKNHHNENPKSPSSLPENLEEKGSQDEKSEKSGEELIRRMSELERTLVFSVPVTAGAEQDRAQAWEKLTSAVPHMILKKEQYLYAQDLLNRYRDAPPLERLVFWRLVDLRIYKQRVSGLSRVAVGGDDYRELRLSMYPQLKAMLYSALDEDSKELPEFLASRKAIEILQVASGVQVLPD